jgi:uncharacterized protein (DUF1810 family)
METAYDLDRFVDAQNAGRIYDRAVAELRDGQKRSHWMWFVFPQMTGLGRSPTSRRFGISGLDEARAYLRHEVLGFRLLECTRILETLEATSAQRVFGAVDALKLRSSMTLFRGAAPDEPLFQHILDRFFDGIGDPAADDLRMTNDQETNRRM